MPGPSRMKIVRSADVHHVTDIEETGPVVQPEIAIRVIYVVSHSLNASPGGKSEGMGPSVVDVEVRTVRGSLAEVDLKGVVVGMAGCVEIEHAGSLGKRICLPEIDRVSRAWGIDASIGQ